MIKVQGALAAHNAQIAPVHQEDHMALMEELANRAAAFWEHGDDVGWCNNTLDEQGHHRLRIRERAEVAPLDFVPDPVVQRQVGSFPAGFLMLEPGQDTRQPIRRQTLEAMRQDYRNPNRRDLSGDHRDRPAFWRALNLAPDLIIPLTVDYSAYGLGMNKRPPASFGPEMYLVYQVMRRLVGKHDRGVLRHIGSTDRGYLFYKTVRGLLDTRQAYLATV